MLLGHWLIKYADAATHAPAHAPARPGITEALGTTDSHMFELGREGHKAQGREGHKAQGRMGKVGRDYSEQYFTTTFRHGYSSHVLHITMLLVSGLCISGYVIAI